MNIILLGAAGFIGTNLTIQLARSQTNKITLVDRKKQYFSNIVKLGLENIDLLECDFDEYTDFANLLEGQDIVYHLLSTTVPTTSNQHIVEELKANVIVTARILECCIKCGVKKVVFLSSGGTVYGKEVECPLDESVATNPITSYGVQKITIEKLLYLYNYMYGLEYRVIRLANPYGPYQRPNGILGAVTTFTYKALKGEEIEVYGDGSVIRDFIYIDDAIRGILNIVGGKSEYKVFNLGCGYGTNISTVLNTIEKTLKIELKIKHKPARKVDVPTNFLDISRYEAEYGKLNPLPLSEGIKKTADFMKQELL